MADEYDPMGGIKRQLGIRPENENPSLRTESVLSSEDLSRYGYRAHQSDRHQDTPAVVEQSKRPSEKSKFEVHADDKAIILALGSGAFCAGLFGFYEGHPVLGTVFTVGGLVTMAPISPFVRSHIGWAFGRPALWTLAAATWLFLAANVGFAVYDHFSPSPSALIQARPSSPLASPPTPKAHGYPDNEEAKAALENLDDVLVKEVQPQMRELTIINLSQAQADTQSQMQMKEDEARRAGRSFSQADRKAAIPDTIKQGLLYHLGRIEVARGHLQKAAKAIADIASHQHTMTAQATQQFFKLPFRDIENAISLYENRINYFLKTPPAPLGPWVFDSLQDSFIIFHQKISQINDQMTGDTKKIASEVLAIGDNK